LEGENKSSKIIIFIVMNVECTGEINTTEFCFS